MIISWNWLRDYVPVEVSAEELAARLTMAGLNLESVAPHGDDVAIDLEVTSNRPDCLGHIGVAREASVLLGAALTIPAAHVETAADRTSDATSVTIECQDLCPQYIARVIRGVKIGPSPAWLQQRLETIGIAPVNNVVDVTNYVLMECGQPLHAFDFEKLRGRRIIVRHARQGETIQAIDHREYQLTPEMCVIADAERPVAVGGVMGGADTEISEDTTTLLIEVANFSPASIRNTARAIRTVEGSERRKGLHSDSSYRFERGVDPQKMMWASARCCELILQTAGGELLEGPVVAGTVPEWKPAPVKLRFKQISRLLGIEIPRDEAISILNRLGLECVGSPSDHSAEFRPPSWRRDLTREADLIEEVARIHGYDRIPEDRAIPVVSGTKSRAEKVTERVRSVLAGAGFDEALTMSFTPDDLGGIFDPAPEIEAAAVEPAAGEYGNRLRKSIIPSLIAVRRENERKGNLNSRLYEVARVFQAPQPDVSRTQPVMIGMVSGGSFAQMRGLLDAIAACSGGETRLRIEAATVPGLREGRSARVWLGEVPWGWLGELDCESKGSAPLKLREAVTVAEVQLEPLVASAQLVPHAAALPAFPGVERDLNFVLEESTSWEQLEQAVRGSAPDWLTDVAFVDQYRGKQVPAGKKSYVLKLTYQAPDRTLTGEEIDAAQQRVVQACVGKLGAALRG
jgi:phenylalanyl-tRNA synthetase beta chain